MPKIVLLDCTVEINGVDLSNHVTSVEVSKKMAGVDTTNMSGGGKEQIPGLSDDEFTVDFQQDFAASSVNSLLWSLYTAKGEFTVRVKPTAAAVSVTNPWYTGTCILLEYQPLSGKVGELSNTKVKFPTQRSGISMVTS